MTQMKIVSASFFNGIGSVSFECGTKKDMTYNEYIIFKRNYNPTSTAKLVKHIQAKGAFYYACHKRPLQQVFTSEPYHFFHGKDLVTRAEFDKMMKLISRYQRFYNYCKEVLPQWKKADTIHYADNSTEEIQVDKNGNRRNVMVKAPSGDACH